MTDAKGMDVHEALEYVRADNEKLEEEVRIKTDLCNNFKRAQDELLTKLQEIKLQSEKQAQELSAKSEELSTLSQLHQDLKSSFQEKELSLKHLNSAIEKLRFEYQEKLQNFEVENKEFVLALEESKTIYESLKSKFDSSNMEIEDLKRVLLLKDKKVEEILDKSRRTNDLIQKDEVISKLEEEQRDVQDQLKWKNEQFQHLEEAHKKIQENFKFTKTEWEKEKSSLVDEICSLQANLESQTRKSENLQTQLRICNQALAHEESKKKLLEVEISEYKSRFDDVFSEFHEAKLTIEKLTHKRDEEVAELRDTLAAKDSLLKEMGYKLEHLEQDNKDLTASLKEFQESQISNCGNTFSLKKLQKKYNNLEQVHKKCSERLKVEDSLKSELEKLRNERDDYSTKLKDQSEQVMQLQKELKSCCLPKVQNKENEDMMFQLKEELDVKNNAICEINLDLSKKCDEVASLMKKVELFGDMKQKQLVVEELLAESSRKQVLLEEQIRAMENSQNLDDKSRSDLEMKNQSLQHKLEDLARVNKLETKNLMDENTCLVNQVNNLVAQNQVLCEENQKLKDEFSGICEKSKVKDESLLKSTQRAEELEDLLRVNKLETKNQMDEKTCLVNRVNNLVAQNQVLCEENQKLKDEFSGLCEKSKVKDESLLKSTQRAEELEDLLRVNKLETKNLMDENTRLVNQVNNLVAQNQVLCEENQKLKDEFSGLCEKSKVKDESLLKSTQRAEELEDLLRVNKLETKNLMDEKTCLVNRVNNLVAQNQVLCEENQKLKDEFSGLCEKSKVKDESLLKSTQRAEELEDLLLVNKLETKNLMDEKMYLVNQVNNLEAQNQALYEDIKKILFQKDDLQNLMETASTHMEAYFKDVELTGMLENMLQKG